MSRESPKDVSLSSLSEILAEKIVSKLVEQKLFTPEDSARYLESISSGKIKSEDWRLAIEKGIDKKELSK